MEKLSSLRFDALAGYARNPWTLLTADEREWYSDANEKVLGVLVQDRMDKDYVCVIMGRDRIGRFRAVHLSPFFPRLRDAREHIGPLLDEWSLKDPREFEQADEPDEAMEFFRPRHPLNRLHLGFVKIATREEYSPAKGIMEAMMYFFRDPDGNFVEQFQSVAFNARFWELYLFALLAEGRYAVDRNHPAPDYSCSGVAGTFFIEAVTVNPTMKDGKIAEPRLQDQDRVQYMEHYLPIKFAGPLTDKLKKKYWEKPHIGDRPIVFAIADFHRPLAMTMSQGALPVYLYGRHVVHRRDWAGNLRPRFEAVKEHVWEKKVVPSGFFNLPDSEHISAVISTREATIAKFNRIGMKAGFGSHRVRMTRAGDRYDRNGTQPKHSRVSVESKTYHERWIDGLEVYHNPKAIEPLNPEAFPFAFHHFLEGEEIAFFGPEEGWFGSKTDVRLAD
jgi:hypothetical protein